MTTPAAVVPEVFAPTPAQVQALLVAREPFTTTTTPTLAQVQQRCTDVAYELAGELTALPASLIGLATSTVIYKVAADIEAGTWPEQQVGQIASGGIWYARYVQAHDRLIALASAYGDTPQAGHSPRAVSQTALASAALFGDEPTTWSTLPNWLPEFPVSF